MAFERHMVLSPSAPPPPPFVGVRVPILANAHVRAICQDADKLSTLHLESGDQRMWPTRKPLRGEGQGGIPQQEAEKVMKDMLVCRLLGLLQFYVDVSFFRAKKSETHRSSKKRKWWFSFWFPLKPTSKCVPLGRKTDPCGREGNPQAA